MKSFFLEIPSDTKYLSDVELHIKKIIDNFNWSEEKINSILIAISEAVNNAIIHGNKRDMNKTVKIFTTITEKNVEVKVKDQGNGFVLDEVPNPLLPENLTKDSGRGILIMRSLVEKFDVVSCADGTEVIFTISL
jgi:serine/threonine-protein kinase RsbW